MALRHLVIVSFCSLALSQDLFLRPSRNISRIGNAAPKPHILFILVDDLGRSEVGFNRAQKTKEVVTPNLDSLASEGIVLDRYYVHKFCSPTRCAIQSGRAPIHVNVVNAQPDLVNTGDPVSGFAGIPRNMTGMAEVMRSAGYSTHMIGKWDAGMATPDHTPAGRGYDTSLIYFHHSNDYWTFKELTGCGYNGVKDSWNMYGNVPFPGQPARNKQNSDNCSAIQQHPGGTCVYEDSLFEHRVKDVIRRHDPSVPLFMFWATHTAHAPHQPPDEEVAKFGFIDNKDRKLYHAMVSWIDGAIGRVVQELKANNMYDNTLIVMGSDNGGPLPTGNNYPLKGGKFSNWEGGIRVAGLVSGGFVPEDVRGTVQNNLVTGWDWYSTFAGLAGADPTDHKAAKAGLPAHDSIDQWPMLSGANVSAQRTRVEIGSTPGMHSSGLDSIQGDRYDFHAMVGGLIVPPYKILIGYGDNDGINMAGWTGPQSPNSSGVPPFSSMVDTCGRTPETGCLFNVYEDPGEHRNLANEKQELFRSLLQELEVVNRSVFSPVRGKKSAAACDAVKRYGGFWGPFLP